MQALRASHIHPPGYRRPLLFSGAGHLSLFLFFLLLAAWRPGGEPISAGTLQGGGSGGGFVAVGLSDELSGGSGMYKPSLLPVPEAAPAPPSKSVDPPPAREIFQETGAPPKKSALAPAPAAAAPPEKASPGAIPRPPDPGSGGSGGAAAGAGGGLGSGQGVTIGPGTGQGTVESWYVRQVEQRVGQNWLRTSLGELNRSVQTVVSFEIRSDGAIRSVQVDQASGIRAVDLAAERAVRASGPLPPLPRDLRGRSLKFVAYFEYPPR